MLKEEEEVERAGKRRRKEWRVSKFSPTGRTLVSLGRKGRISPGGLSLVFGAARVAFVAGAVLFDGQGCHLIEKFIPWQNKLFVQVRSRYQVKVAQYLEK